MAKVLTIWKIIPEDMEVFEDLKEGLKKEFGDIEMGEEEIGFGIKMLKIKLILEENEGTYPTEEKLKNIKGVAEVELEYATRL